MNKSNKLLSDIVAFRTYAKYLPHAARRESLEETINRNMTMHLENQPKLSRDIIKAYKQVHDLKQMPIKRINEIKGDKKKLHIVKSLLKEFIKFCKELGIDDAKK